MPDLLCYDSLKTLLCTVTKELFIVHNILCLGNVFIRLVTEIAIHSNKLNNFNTNSFLEFIMVYKECIHSKIPIPSVTYWTQ